MIARHQAPGGGFFDTSDDHRALITRARDLQDNATPSGNAMAVTALLKFAGLTSEIRYVHWGHQAPAHTLSKPREIAIVGDPDSDATQALLKVACDGYRPFQVVALGAPDSDAAAVPLLQNRGLVEGQAAAHVCRDFACQAPVVEVEALKNLVEGRTLV